MSAVFVHGVPDSHHLWDFVWAELDRDDVVAVDLPGFGCGIPGGFGATLVAARAQAEVASALERLWASG